MSDTVSRQCRRLREWLPEYAEGRLSGEPRAAVEQHLVECGRCTQEVAALRAMLSALRAIPAEAPPDSLVPGVRRAVARHVAASRRHAPRPFWARIAVPAAAATGLLAVVLGYRIMEQGYSPKSMGSAMEVRRQASAPRPQPAPPVTSAPVEAPTQVELQAPAAGAAEAPAVAKPPRATATPPALVFAPPPAPRKDNAAKPSASPLLDLPRGSSEERTAAAKGRSDQPAPAALQSSSPPAPAPQVAGGRPVAEAKSEAVGAAAEPSRDSVMSRRGKPNQASGGPWRSGRFRSDRQVRKGHGRAGREFGPTAGGSAKAAPRLAAAARVQAPASARVILTREGNQLALAVQLDSWPQGETVEVKTGDQELWRGAPAGPQRIVVSLEGKDGRPQTLPITLTSPSGSRSYTLFAPPFALLGQQSGPAVRRYHNTPLSKVLADLSAKGGLVLLVEGGLDREVNGELALDTPKAAVDTLAKYAGYIVRTDDLLVYTLTPRP